MPARHPLRAALHAGLWVVLMLAFASPASAIPAFARKYGLQCTSCHESWPVLNDFGRNFRDNGYQLRLGKDDTVTASPGYWPVAVHATPTYAYTTTSNQPTDQGKKSLATGGVADAAIDLLMAGTLTDNISFLVVPTGFASDGNAHLESYWAYFSRVIQNSDWFNVRIGQHEVDLPASSHRPLSLTSGYLVYSYHPGPDSNVAAGFDMGANQRGVEFAGHDRTSLLRYNVSVFSANGASRDDPQASRHALSAPSVYVHLQKYLMLDSPTLSEVELGVFGAYANYPTTSLTLGGDPIPGTGGDLRTTTRYGAEAQAWFGDTVAPLHLTLVYARGSDSKDLYVGAADRSGTWNGGFLEALWVPGRDLLNWGIFARYDLIRNQTQPVASAPSDLNDQDQITAGVRYTIRYSHRDEVALHLEYSTNRAKGIAFDGSDVRSSTLMVGVDFAY